MISVITRWDEVQMPRELEYRMWTQLKGAFAFHEITFVENDEQMAEALALTGDRPKVFLEPGGHKSLADMPVSDDIVFVLSNTERNNLNFVTAEEAYRIITPNFSDLYGITAAAIALYYRVS